LAAAHQQLFTEEKVVMRKLVKNKIARCVMVAMVALAILGAPSAPVFAGDCPGGASSGHC
jgi:hypothetical protein